MTETRIINYVPEDQVQPTHTPFRETCTGKKCLWCTLTGYHNQTPLERNQLIKQIAIGILILTILIFIIIVAIGMAFKVIF